MSSSTLDVVKGVFVEITGVDPEKVVLGASLADDLGADSLDAIEIVMALEEHYGLEFEGEGIEGIKTVGDIVALIDAIVV